ncbi:MAG TPA: endonuclease/exonuclease/phosphatase family protein [Prolixibacteraceae bacterium]|nr:endonuclease/exonuclease/phosphatase family protein [Prolixibacteraceae bacterium]
MKNFRFTILIMIALSIISSHRVDGQNKNAIQSSGYQYEKPVDGVVRILTYNVRNGRGMDDRTDYDRVANVIIAIHPEVVALQELDSVTIRSNGVDVLKAIAEKCEMNYFYGASIPYQGGKYGIGILSKETPLKTTFFPLPGTEEKRGLLMAEFKEYIFFCSHFSLTEADRVASVQLINKKGTELHKRVIMAGDLNATPQSEAIKSLSEHWINFTGNQPTFPSSGPKECIDYIWGISCCNFNYNIMKQEVVPEKIASDHCPVFVDVSFK